MCDSAVAQQFSVCGVTCSVAFVPQDGWDVSPVSVCHRLTFIRMKFGNVKL